MDGSAYALVGLNEATTLLWRFPGPGRNPIHKSHKSQGIKRQKGLSKGLRNSYVVETRVGKVIEFHDLTYWPTLNIIRESQ